MDPDWRASGGAGGNQHGFVVKHHAVGAAMIVWVQVKRAGPVRTGGGAKENLQVAVGVHAAYGAVLAARQPVRTVIQGQVDQRCRFAPGPTLIV